MASELPEQMLTKLNQLADICDHIQDISRKISEMEDDPLQVQLNQSVPNYNQLLLSHMTMLHRRQWVFVLAGT